MSMPDRLPVMGEQRPRGVPPAWSLCGASAAEVRSQCGQAGVLRGGHTQHTRAHIPTLKRMHTHACVPVHVHTCRHTCTHTGGWWQRSRGWSDVTTAKGLPHHQGWEGAGPPSRPCAGMLPAGTCVMPLPDTRPFQILVSVMQRLWPVYMMNTINSSFINNMCLMPPIFADFLNFSLLND